MHPKLALHPILVGSALFAALSPAFAVSTTGVTNTYNGNTGATGLTANTAPTNWSLGIPFFSNGPGAYADLLFTGTSGSLFRGTGTNPNMLAESYNVTNGSSYTLQINATSTTVASIFRVGATSNTGTSEVTLPFVNSVSGIAQDLIYLSGGSSLAFNATNTTVNGLPTRFEVRQAGNYNLSSGSVLTFNTAISGNHAIAINGAGRVVYNAANSSTALTTINGGTLELGAADVIANTAALTVAGGTLDIKTFTDTVGAVTLSSGSITGTTGVLTAASYAATGSGTISAILGGSGVTLSKSGAGTLVLTAANTYTGDTSVTEGTLQVGNGGTTGTLGNNSNTSVASGATLLIERSTDSFGYAYSGALSGDGTVVVPAARRLNFQTNNQAQSGGLAFTLNGVLGVNSGSGVTDVRLGELSGSGLIQRAGNAPVAPAPITTLVVGGKNTDSTYSGTITTLAEFALEKVGSGTLTLSGTSYGHGSGTTVTAGTLLVNGAFNQATNAVSVTAAAVLGGTGTIAGATTIDGTLASGSNGVGMLTFGNGLTVNGTSVWEIDANSSASGFDSVGLTGGNLTLGGSSMFQINPLAGVDFSDSFWASAQSWSVIDNTGSGTIGGTFSSIGGTVSNAFGSFALAYGSGAGGDVILNWTPTAIPEPSTFAALAGLGALGIAGLRRRARS